MFGFVFFVLGDGGFFFRVWIERCFFYLLSDCIFFIVYNCRLLREVTFDFRGRRRVFRLGSRVDVGGVEIFLFSCGCNRRYLRFLSLRIEDFIYRGGVGL